MNKQKRVDFISPAFEELNGGGIYRIVFDTGFFYIGSTKNFRIRKGCLKSAFKRTPYKDNKRVESCISISKSVTFEILEIVPDFTKLKKIETKFIKGAAKDKNLLNSALTGYSNKGVKWSMEDRIKFKAKSKELFRSGILKSVGYLYIMKPVIIYDLTGNEIAKFPTIEKASEYLKCSSSAISDRLKGLNKLGKPYKGYTFKYA